MSNIIKTRDPEDPLVSALNSLLGPLEFAYILDSIPEPGANNLKILIPERRIAKLVVYDDGEIESEVITLVDLRAKSQSAYARIVNSFPIKELVTIPKKVRPKKSKSSEKPTVWE